KGNQSFHLPPSGRHHNRKRFWSATPPKNSWASESPPREEGWTRLEKTLRSRSLTSQVSGVSGHLVCGAEVGFAEVFLMPQPPLLPRRGLRSSHKRHRAPLQFVFVSNTGFVDEGKNGVALGQSHEATHKFCTRPMSQAEESHQLVIDESLPCVLASPRK